MRFIALSLVVVSVAVAESSPSPSPSPAPVAHAEYTEAMQRLANEVNEQRRRRQAPASFTLVYDGGKRVDVRADGTVKLSGGARLDDASRAFWEAVVARSPWGGCGKLGP